MPLKARGKQKGRGQIPPCQLVICILLIVNMGGSLYLQLQVRDVRNMLGQMRQAGFPGEGQGMSGGNKSSQNVSSVAGGGDDGNGGQQAVSGKVYGATDPRGGSQGTGNVKDAGNQGNTGASGGAGNAGGNSGNVYTEGGAGNAEPVSGSGIRPPQQDYVELCGLDEVEKPMKRTEREVLQRLKELSLYSDLVKLVYDNAELYTGRMLEALANNPEMADFVAAFPEAEKRAQGGFTDSEKGQEFPLFLQWDPRWGYVEYGDDGSIGLAGCGPTCLSMVLWYLLEDESLTPDFIAEYSMENGYYVWGAGTAWALLEEFPAMYGVDVWQPGISEMRMKEALDQGCLLICSMSEGDFTTGGHFIVIYGYDKNGFKVNDSNCVARSRRRWSYEQIGDQIKQVWSYGLGDGAGVEYGRKVTVYGEE